MSDDLNRELAEAMGWTNIAMRPPTPFDGWTQLTGLPPGEVGESYAVARGYGGIIVPDFTTSLDALRDGPEKVLREAGWALELHSPNVAGLDTPAMDYWLADWWAFSGRRLGPEETVRSFSARGETEAEARARAALAALRALKVEASK